jgi:hypothetical protein
MYSIDLPRQLIRTACVRPLSFAQVIDHFRELNEDPACSGRLDVLLDVMDIDSLPDSSQLGAVGTAVIASRKKVQFGSCAVVADGDALFGMMRVFEVKAGDYFEAIRVFRRMAEAEMWLSSKAAPRNAGA